MLKINNSKLFVKACILFVGFLAPISIFGQNQAIADSLVFMLNNGVSDSTRQYLLWKISSKHTDQDSVLYYSNLLISEAKPTGEELWIYRGYLYQGHAHKRKGDLDKALSSYLMVERYAQKTNRLSGVGVTFIALGDVYKRNKNHQNSVLYYNKAIDIFRNFGDSIKLATALLNAGDEYFNHNELDTALLYFKESEKIFESRNYQIGIAYNLGNVGLVYAKQGKHDLAEKNINKATIILEELNDRYPIAVYDTYMADIYLEKGDFPRALRYAKHSLQIGEEEGLKEQIRDACLKLSELYGLIEDHKNAYLYQSQYIAYRDSVNNEETIQKLADLRTEYEVAKKQTEVDLLEQEKELQQIINLGMGVVLLLSIILAVVLYYMSKHRKLANAYLSRQKATVEQQRDKLEKLNSTKDRFFSIVSHDLRGPVNAFTGLAELMKLYVDNKAYDDLKEVTTHVEKSSTQLSALLDNLLSWAVSQQGQFPHHPENINLARLFDELTGVFKNMASAKNIAINVDCDQNISAFVDQNGVMTIFRNLINNAVKFTKVGGSISINATPNKDHIEVRVSDTGVGMSQDKLKMLFELKEKKSTWGTGGEKGFGIGLQLAYDLVAMNKGQILVDSVEGVGTTFTITFPISKA